MAALFRYVPNTDVRWGHAWMGGFFVSTGLEIAKKALAIYLARVPTYSVVYGAFATVPILLVWIYVTWVIVLLGAALTAYLPSLIAGGSRRSFAQGWQFQLALEVLHRLEAAQACDARGLALEQLCSALDVDPLRLEPVLEELVQLDWIGQLGESGGRSGSARFVLLVNPAHTLLAPLAQRLLLGHNPVTRKIWETSRLPAITLRDVL
jgi:membrane protein